jgi:hypothetical protein
MNTTNGDKGKDEKGNPSSDLTAPTAANNKAPLMIRLTDGQERDVLRQVLGEDETQDWILASLSDPERLRTEETAKSLSDVRLSRAMIRGFSIVTVLAPPGTERGIIEIAGALEMSPPQPIDTLQRSWSWGLVEQGRSRKYRLPNRARGEHHTSE